MEGNIPSLWNAITSQKIKFPSLTQNHEIDVAIVGAGITGILTAYQLINSGKKIAIFEKDTITQSTTAFSTGNLYVPIQPLYQVILNKFNFDIAKAVIQSRQAAIDYIEQIVLKNNLICNFERRSWFLHTNDKKKVKIIDEEVEIFEKAGCKISTVDHFDMPFPMEKAIRMDNQARLNPLQFILRVAEILQGKGCNIYENTPVLHYEERDSHCILHTQHHKIIAQKMVLATHVPLGINTKQMLLGPYRSYVVAAKTPANKYPNGNYWDLESPHHAISTHSSSDAMDIDIVAIAGNHHKTGQDKNAAQNFRDLEKILHTAYKIDTPEYHWSAQHYQSADKLPYIGLASPNSRHTYMATGFFADGLVYGAISALILSDLILSGHHQWHEVYRSNRFTPFASAATFFKENINVFIQYMKDFPGNCDVRELTNIQNGEGKLIESNGEKIAAYRDNNGKVHCVSAVCTHMKGIVKWNNAETTWDCPCHGSRFTIEGKVIEGPALKPLMKKELKK